jgi:hypothetical protein
VEGQDLHGRHNYDLKTPDVNNIVQWHTQEFCLVGGSTLVGGSSTNSVEDRGQTERGSGGGSPLVRGSAQLANE